MPIWNKSIITNIGSIKKLAREQLFRFLRKSEQKTTPSLTV